MTEPIEIGFHAPALPDMTPWGVVKEPHFRERLADIPITPKRSFLDSCVDALAAEIAWKKSEYPDDGETVAD